MANRRIRVFILWSNEAGRNRHEPPDRARFPRKDLIDAPEMLAFRLRPPRIHAFEPATRTGPREIVCR
jgi:hypothetical protein